MIKNKILIILLVLSSIVFGQFEKQEVPKYDRKYFKHWVDVDKDCQSARVEVLIEESKYPVTYKTKDSCAVDIGVWYGLFYDTLLFHSKHVDVDHFVPLKNAWESGAWKWTDDRRKEYANYLDDPDHLIAVSSSANRSKGAKSPDQWLPKNKNYIKKYCKTWCKIKVKWGLSVTHNEFMFLKRILEYEDVTFPRVRH